MVLEQEMADKPGNLPTDAAALIEKIENAADISEKDYLLSLAKFLKSGTAGAAIGNVAVDLPSTAVRMALAVVGILPMVVVFPLLQKYFIKGMVIGAVKG